MLISPNRGTMDKPADEGGPEAVEDKAPQDLRDAEEDKEKGNDLASDGGDPRGALYIPCPLPDNGPEHPSPIKGKAGDHVKQGEYAVDDG